MRFKYKRQREIYFHLIFIAECKRVMHYEKNHRHYYNDIHYVTKIAFKRDV